MQSKIHDWLSKDYESKYQEYETHLFYSLPLLYHTKTVHLHYKCASVFDSLVKN